MPAVSVHKRRINMPDRLAQQKRKLALIDGRNSLHCV